MGRAATRMDLSRKKELPRGLRTGTHSGKRELLGWAQLWLQGGSLRGWAERVTGKQAVEPWEEARGEAWAQAEQL